MVFPTAKGVDVGDRAVVVGVAWVTGVCAAAGLCVQLLTTEERKTTRIEERKTTRINEKAGLFMSKPPLLVSTRKREWEAISSGLTSSSAVRFRTP
jgi:hypothetical protein